MLALLIFDLLDSFQSHRGVLFDSLHLVDLRASRATVSSSAVNVHHMCLHMLHVHHGAYTLIVHLQQLKACFYVKMCVCVLSSLHARVRECAPGDKQCKAGHDWHGPTQRRARTWDFWNLLRLISFLRSSLRKASVGCCALLTFLPILADLT